MILKWKKLLEGNEVSMEDYKGKVLLIVNTATGCGFTPQYEKFQKVYDKYKDQGFEMLDFPSNQFFEQAPGTNLRFQIFASLHMVQLLNICENRCKWRKCNELY